MRRGVGSGGVTGRLRLAWGILGGQSGRSRPARERGLAGDGRSAFGAELARTRDAALPTFRDRVFTILDGHNRTTITHLAIQEIPDLTKRQRLGPNA